MQPPVSEVIFWIVLIVCAYGFTLYAIMKHDEKELKDILRKD